MLHSRRWDYRLAIFRRVHLEKYSNFGNFYLKAVYFKTCDFEAGVFKGLPSVITFFINPKNSLPSVSLQKPPPGPISTYLNLG